MDIFCFLVLEDTIDKLAKRPILHNRSSRLAECVTVIRACMDLWTLSPDNRDYTNKIRQTLPELAGIARQSGDLVSAWRLKMVLGKLESPKNAEWHLAQTA